MMPVKADLAICSSLIGVSGLCKSMAFMASHYWDISSCGIVPSFLNPVAYMSSQTSQVNLWSTLTISSVNILSL